MRLIDREKTELLLGAIKRFSELRVLVIGDVMLDVYEFCSSEQSKPIDSEKSGKLAYKAQSSIKELGGAGNVAANLASLGVHTSLIGLTGNDEHYFKIRELADERRIAHVLVRDASRPTTTKTRLYVDDEYLLRRDYEATHPVDHETSTTVLNETLRECPRCQVVILSDYNKGIFTLENAQKIIRECRLHRIPAVVDFKPTNREYFSGADVIAPNDVEAAVLLPEFSKDQLNLSVKSLHAELGCRSTVVTLGADGICGTDGSSFFHVPGNTVKAIDTVGSGDTVRAGLALGIACGLSLESAAELANDAAAVIVQKPATAFMTREELVEFIMNKMGSAL